MLYVRLPNRPASARAPPALPRAEDRSALRGGEIGPIYSDAEALAAASAFIFSANRASASLAGEYPASGLTLSHVVPSQCPHSAAVMYDTCTIREAEGART